MTNQQPPQSVNSSSSEFVTLEKAFKTWDITSNDAPQAMFTAHLYNRATLEFGVYGTHADHPAVGTPEDWDKAFKAAWKGSNRQISANVGNGQCCIDPADGRIKGILFVAFDPLSGVREFRTNQPVFVDWVLDKLHWIWRQAFAEKPYPVIRKTDLSSHMHADEICRAEFPITKADESLPLLFDGSPETRHHGMVTFIRAEDQEWMQTIFRVLWPENNASVIEVGLKLIAHFKAEHKAALFIIDRLNNDLGISDRFPNDGPIARDRNLLRLLGTSAAPAMLELLPRVDTAAPELVTYLIAIGDPGLKPVLEAMIADSTTPEWKQRQFKTALERVNGKQS